ncbi:MAG: hypothetical protein R3A13_11075 [Bdellovibrionota bacterium]
MLQGIYSKSGALTSLKSISSLPTVSRSSTKNTLSSKEAAYLSIKNTLSSVAVEKHINDYENGKGYLSKGISADLRRQDLQNSFDLAGQDPKLFTSYLLNSTALNYQGKARFIDAVSKSTETVARINTASEQDPGAAIMEQYKNLTEQAEKAANGDAVEVVA